MLRKGVCCGRIRPIRTGAGQAACLQAGAEDCWEEQTAVIYCVRGGVTLTADGWQLRRSQTDCAVLRFCGCVQLRASGEYPGVCMLVEIWPEKK